MEQAHKSIHIKKKDTYLALIRNSVGTKTFRNIFAKVDGKKKDILEDGNLSCAYYVSSLLTIAGLISGVHATVSGTVRDLVKNGWIEIKKPKQGAVIVWENVDFGLGEVHGHIGFYIGDNKAVSNDYKKGCPAIHGWTYNGKRKIKTIFWNQNIG